MSTRDFEQYGSALSPEDYQSLERCYINPALADAAGLRRLTNEQGKEVVGRRDHEDYAGILFPFVWPGEQRSHNHRIRRDNPPYECRKGKRKERDKYLSPPGYGNGLYFHPATRPEVLRDTAVPLVMTEGQKKTLALHRLSTEVDAFDGLTPFTAVGLNGVWGWKGKIGIVGNATGHRVSEKGVISDISRIEWDGRRVYILYDTNVHTDPLVAAARNRLAQELADRGAEVYLIDLPVEDGINGIDDFLARHGADAALALFNEARLFDPNERLAKLHYTDLGNEEAFEFLQGKDFLYNWTAKEWLKWDGTIWSPDTTGLADRAMVEVARARLQATHRLREDPTEFSRTGDIRANKKKAIAAALKLENTNNRAKALESARTSPQFARKAEEFDQNDYLFACANGVIDLLSCEFRPGRRSDLITKAAAASWEPTAGCDAWLTFLSQIFPNRPDLITFLQRAVGYSLTGLTREEVFFILHGLGRNGKGTFLRVLMAVLGSHAVNTEFSTLIADRDRGKGPRNDIATLSGKRFVAAQESREGAQLDESLIKTLTGGDLITARFLHKEFFTFRPTWKIWLATNHKPEIRGTDTGIWSRPKLIPFTVSFDGREDKGLKDALLAEHQLSGVLKWAVEGCRDYLAEGLNYPEEVIQATAAYRQESDLVEQFIAECCRRGDAFSTKARPLYQAFAKWAEGTSGLSETAFGRRMTEKGYKSQHGGGGKTYFGITPITAKEPDEGW